MDRPLPRPTRRQAIGAMGAGAAAAWVAPAILSVDAARAATLPPLDLTAVAGRDSDFVIATSDGRAFRSLDAGLNWTTNTAPPPPPGTNLVVAANSGTNDFIVVTADGQVWYTINAGYTWNPASVGPSITGVVAAAGVDGDLVIINGTGDVWRSSDDGDTWVAATTPPSAITNPAPPIVALSAGAGMFIAVASDGQVFSSPGGDGWSQTTSPGSVPFTAVACNDLDTCAVAGSSLVYRCEIDSPWSTIDTGVPNLVVVAADGQDDFIAVSTTGTVARSVDFGNDWTSPVLTPPTFTMTQVAGDHDGYYVGIGAGQVARSLDYGNTWQDPLTPPS